MTIVMKSITNKKMPEHVAIHMRSPFDTGYRSRITWSEALRLGVYRKSVGEIRTLESWESLPRDKRLRAIYITDDKGPVIRWGDPETMDTVLSGNIHDNLVCEGDKTIDDARSGWITVSKDGIVSVDGKILS
jgi:hypothetical protein